jgi:hypothetical protein
MVHLPAIVKIFMKTLINYSFEYFFLRMGHWPPNKNNLKYGIRLY